MKNVLLVVIDALASRIIRPAMEQGKLPNMRALAHSGRVDWDCTAIFPSITPAATAALVTGGYPADTGITGAYFYDRKQDRVHYYGDDTWVMMRRGISNFFDYFIVSLNRDQLRIDTTFQTVERSGKRAACLNYLWFRGEVSHRIRVPWLLRLWPWIERSKTVSGPAILSLGDFVSATLGETGPKLKGPGGLFNRYGFSDTTTGTQLLLLAQERAFPDFTVAYFPDNDFASHTDGPQDALRAVEKVDRVLGQLIACYGGIDSFLKSLAIVITGDHAQSDLPFDKQETGILLDETLKDYNVVPAGKDWGDGDELMICPNMRAAQIYLRRGYMTKRAEIVRRLLGDERIDQVIWREAKNGGQWQYLVETARHGTLSFCRGEGGEHGTDAYGGRWKWKGNLACVDGRRGAGGVLEFGDYPNAMERVAGAFNDRDGGDIWVTSRLGYEFRLGAMHVNRKGSHGSLHKDDSFSPLIMAGVPKHLLPQRTPRSVDVAPLCLAILELAGPFDVGDSRADLSQPIACR
jgi:hypothetical protein